MEQASAFERMPVPDMVVVEVRIDDDLDLLLPGETPPGARPGSSRYRELQAGRHCAARALHQAGMARQPLLADGAGAPQWPDGWVGSITHSGGRCAAAVVKRSAAEAIGIDMERPRAMSQRAARRVCTPDELAICASLPPIGAPWPLVVFSLKESFYKAWWPRHHQRLAFQDVQIARIGDAVGSSSTSALRFRASDPSGALEGSGVLAAQDLAAFRALAHVDAGWVRTVVWLPRTG